MLGDGMGFSQSSQHSISTETGEALCTQEATLPPGPSQVWLCRELSPAHLLSFCFPTVPTNFLFVFEALCMSVTV